MQNFLSNTNKNKFFKAISIGLACILAFLFLLVFIIKNLISFTFIENKILEKTGLKVEFVEPEVNFDFKFNVKFKANELKISDKTNQKQFVQINNPQINFKPIILLFNKAYFKNINADKIIIKLTKDKNGSIDLISSLNKDLTGQFSKKINLTRLNLNIKEAKIFYNDECQNKHLSEIQLNNTILNISKRQKSFNFSQKGKIKTNVSNNSQIADLNIDISSKYPFENINSKNLKADIDLQNVNLHIFNDLIKKYISNDINSFNGKLDLKISTIEDKQNLNLKLSNPTFKLNNEKIISPYKQGININSILFLDKNKITLEKSEISGQNLYINVKGEVTNLNTKPNTQLNLEIKNTQANNLFHFIPDNAIFYRPEGIPTLKKSNFHGIIDGELKIKTSPLDIQGTIKAQNVHIPNYPKPYMQNDVKAIFMKDKLRIVTRVYTPDNEYVTVDGISNLDDSLYGQYSIKSTKKIDLAFAQLYLVPIQQIIGFNIGPVPIMDISGYGNIDINTKGTLEDAQIFGNFEAYNATAKIDGLATKLIDGDCKLIFEDRNLFFKEIKGNLEGANFLLTGKGNTRGEVKLNAKIKNADAKKILDIFNNSLISKSYSKLLEQIKSIDGNLDIDADLIGKIDDYENKEFLNSLKPSGRIKLKDIFITLKDNINLKDLSGEVSFGNIQNGTLNFNSGNSKIDINFNSNENLEKIAKGESFKINTEVFSSKFAFSDIISFLNNEKLSSTLNDLNFYTKFLIKSSGFLSLDNLNLKSFKHNGYIVGLNDSTIKNIKFNNGIIKLINDKITVENFDLNYKTGKIFAKGSLSNISNLKPFGDLSIYVKDIVLDDINKHFPNIKTTNNVIKKGVINFKGNDLKLNGFSLDCTSVPIYLNAAIKDIYSAKITDVDFSTIINEKSSDELINPYLITPIKIQGEIPIKGTFKGSLNTYSFDFSAILPKDSDILFSGANLGDINHKRELQGKINIFENIIKINNLKLMKYIANSNNKVNPIIAAKANGQFIKKENGLNFNNLKISTNTPINVKVLNLLFNKSLLKNGNFDCNIVLNDDVKLPKINGKIDLYDLDIPLYNTEINNIKINISDKFIDGVILAKNKESDVKIRLHALNKLIYPIVIKDIIVSSNKINLNDIIKSLEPSEFKTDITAKPEIAINPNDLIIEKGSFDIKEASYDAIVAQNLLGNLNYTNGEIDISNVNFDIAQGKINAKGNYNLNTANLIIDAKMTDCDSNTLAKNFLGLQNQIFGKMDGSLSLNAKNLNTPQAIQNIKSDIDFSITNGKMPKLGSLEYLLRAGNLFKNGILGLSLNNIIEVLTPYKTGEFEKISGKLSINNAQIENLNILSQGKNLSLYLEGNYSLFESFADIKIYGKLSQKISNALGALGNASINQFIEIISQTKRNKNEKDSELQEKLNKIPPLELQESEPRYFKAKVLGDINKENYIKSFNWI